MQAMSLLIVERRLILARQRIVGAVEDFGDAIRGFLGSVVPGGNNLFRPALTPEERSRVASWMNSEQFSDRTREFEFQALDPRTGQTGTFKTTINGLLLVEQSYDTSKLAIQRILNELVSDGLLSLTEAAPTEAERNQLPSDWRERMERQGAVALPPDTRLRSGLWGNFPLYSPLRNGRLEQRGQVMGFDRAAPALLPHFPVPTQWRRYYPGHAMYARQGSGWAVSRERIVTILDQLTLHCALLVKGANGNIEFHPAVAAFNNGTQFPSPEYPPEVGTHFFHNIEDKHRYFVDHRWATTTVGARGSSTGLVIHGKQDAHWLTSLDHRTRMAWGERHENLVSNHWGKIEVADAVADFVRWANLASFLADIGATAHVHACAEAHNALSIKAMRELNLPVASPAEAGIVREREARQVRAAMSRVEELDRYVAALQLATDNERAAATAASMDILRGGLVASAQLFMVNPIAGAVAAVIVGCAALMAWLFGGGLAERRYPEQILIRDGLVRVRAKDEADDPQGDIYGGNMYPWTRERAIRGTPVLRAKDALGRMYE